MFSCEKKTLNENVIYTPPTPKKNSSKKIQNSFGSLEDALNYPHPDQVITLDLAYSDVKIISNDIGKFKNLENLNLERRRLNSLPKEIGNLKKMKKLFLSGNNFTSFPTGITMMKDLEELNLSFTSIKKLPLDIGNLKKLRNLNLTSSGLSELPEEFGELSNLEYLSLSGNNIKKFPKSFYKLNLKLFTYSKVYLSESDKEKIRNSFPNCRILLE